jgi:two-component system nitrogen regulation sensor histidine kinase NtrY
MTDTATDIRVSEKKGGLLQRLPGILRPRGPADAIALMLIVAGSISGAATFISLATLEPLAPNATKTLILVNIDLFIVVGLALLVARRLVRLWKSHRAGTVGSKLQVRLVALFGVIAMTPTVLIALFSILFFALGVQTWFSARVKTAVDESAAIARAYLLEHQQAIKADALAVASDVNRQWSQFAISPTLRDNALSTQIAFRGLTEAVIFRPDGQVIAKAGYTFSLAFGDVVPFAEIAKADAGQVPVITGENLDRVRALVRLEPYTGAYLYVGRFVDPQVVARVTRAEAAASEYQRLERQRSELEASFTILFAVVALLLLLVSIWFGMTLARRLASPIIDLISAAERVRGGDLTVQVQEGEASDEVSVLSRAFNRMTSRLGEQQSELRDTNAQLDERRRFTEAVLAGVSAGVIGLDRAGNITLPNRSASLLLGQDLTDAIGKPLSAVAPDFARLLEEVVKAPQRVVQHEIQVAEGGMQKTFLVRLSSEQVDGTTAGYVMTFDDITALQSAQRKAAWADVARRIAHEIKNPLTPIQLSAERLKRKYSGRLPDDGGLFAQCTDTIIRHVGDIGHMVDEFSAFARLPAAILRPTEMGMVIRESMVLQRTAYPNIAFTLELPGPVRLKCDVRQVGQALTNVLKNAVEAIQARFGPAVIGQKGPGAVTIHLETTRTEILVRVIDNGTGLPQSSRERLTEPYVTTRAKGTGLGLAIVKKIMEDHGGNLSLEDAPPEETAADKPADKSVRVGAQVTLHFPITLALDVTKTDAETSAPARQTAAIAGE